MKIHIAIAFFAFSVAANATDKNPLETVDQARQRQSAENYETYKKQDNPLLPPSYQRPIGDPSVQGVDRPGYTPQQPAYGGDWRDRAKR